MTELTNTESQEVASLENFRINLSPQEKKACLKEIKRKNKRILYVYQESLKPGSNFNYKVYVGSVLLYVSTSNYYFEDYLINILINLTTILNNDLDEAQIKKIIFENANILSRLLSKAGE